MFLIIVIVSGCVIGFVFGVVTSFCSISNINDPIITLQNTDTQMWLV